MEGVPPCKDRDDFIKVLKANGGKPGFYSLHTGNNPFIKITGAVHAEGIWDAFFVGIDVPDRLTYQLTGQYNCKYVLRNGRWYIQVQQFRQTSLLINKLDEKVRRQPSPSACRTQSVRQVGKLSARSLEVGNVYTNV